MFIFHTLFGVLSWLTWFLIGFVYLAIGIVVNRPLLKPLWDGEKDDYPRNDNEAIRRGVTLWYFLAAIVWPVSMFFGFSYILAGTAPQFKDAEAEAKVKAAEAKIKEYEKTIREWEPVNQAKWAAQDATDYARDLRDEAKDKFEDLRAKLEAEVAKNESLTSLRDAAAAQLTALRQEFAKGREQAERSTSTSRRREASNYDTHGWDD